jgi:WD40 repeat protein
MRALLIFAISAVAGAQSLPGDRIISSDSGVQSLSFSADGGLIAGTCEDGRIRLWDTRTGKLDHAVSFEKDSSGTLADRADLLAVAGSDGGVKIWDLKSGEVGHRFTGPVPRVREFAFSRDRTRIAGASRTNADGSEFTVRIWDTNGTEQRSMSAGLGGVSAMAFSPDGGTIVAAGFDTNLRAWNTRDGELLRLMDELPLSMFAMAFSPDGKHLATAGADRIVYLWDTKSWRIVRRLTGQPELISAIAFSPDGRLLLTGGVSEVTFKNPVKVMLWDLASGQPLRSMPSAHGVLSVAFSPDGSLAAAANMDRTVSLWAVPLADGR